MKAFLLALSLLFTSFVFAQNVGIGTATPAYKLDVAGIIRTSSDCYVGNFLGIGTANPLYKLQVNDGSVAVYNTADAKFWAFNYSSTGNYFRLHEDEVSRLVIANGGNVGIGTSAPADKLHVSGGNVRVNDGLIQFDAAGVEKGFVQLSGDNLRIGTFSSNNTGSFIVRTNGLDRMRVDAAGAVDVTGDLAVADDVSVASNVSVGGNLTVNAGKGIIRNAEGSAQLKYYTEAFTFSTGALPGNALSGEGSIIFSVPFSSTPVVYVGNIVSTGGSVGELYRVQLILYGCNTTSCKARLLNTSPNPVNYSITWNVVCIGQ